ncbi:cation diffusion facilitator family transporter [Pyrococcus abyssi]|uniref:Cation efflux system protein (Cobalt/zinc/cadmium) n=1 Tax=Pyrococcus abyssi (strain GE5 / Orsay) TaxID=272844 RepID=Q9V0W0_PYRAB|nr:cation diffusion facilitator family transporter [Pyrococcus abyssi]CAB49593.1 Cation efflux system protein (cobalt/zinc/cadmium) [Pyrococcus abyssi GE5]CCE70066.1 TPA: cation efflux system protein (zinc/cadmium) [Pyrococcus abyssi GE5]
MEEELKPLIVSIIGNTVLGVVKLVVGLFNLSIALISDGIHSLSDTVTSVVGFVGVKLSKKPPDESHPFGHSRFEPLFAFFMGELLIVVAYEIARDSLGRMLSRETIRLTPTMVIVALLSILVKELMTRYALSVGKRLDNKIIIADAYHHRSDVLSTIVVLVGFGLQRLGIWFGDALAGFVVALFVGKVGVEILLENVNYLTGRAPPYEVCKKIEEVARSVDGVLGVHDLRAHYVGTKLHVELHIEVSPETSLKKAHDISEEVKRKVESLPEVSEAFIHVDIRE